MGFVGSVIALQCLINVTSNEACLPASCNVDAEGSCPLSFSSCGTQAMCTSAEGLQSML